jgi:very-short-patch-repair endonuclease
VTSPVCTWLDLAALLGPDELVVLGDAAWRAPAFGRDVDARLAAASGRRGVRNARAARARLRQGVDSPQESRLRLVVGDAALPEPDVNVDVYDGTGAWLARPDLSWPRQRVAVEDEGDHRRTNQAQWRRDIGRDAALQAAGWAVLRVTASDLQQPDRIVARIRAALTRP